MPECSSSYTSVYSAYCPNFPPVLEHGTLLEAPLRSCLPDAGAASTSGGQTRSPAVAAAATDWAGDMMQCSRPTFCDPHALSSSSLTSTLYGPSSFLIDTDLGTAALTRPAGAAPIGSEEEHLCKICYEGADADDAEENDAEVGELVRPCACRGSAAYIHIGCLKQWHRSLGNPTTLRCPTCKQAYVGNVAIELAQMNVVLVEDVLAGKGKDKDTRERSRWRELHATVLTQLAQVLSSQGRYEEALPLFQRSLHVRIKLLGPERLEVAESLDAMAELYRMQGQYEDALRLKRRALWIREKVLGVDHPGTATSYNNLGLVLQSMDRLDEAKPYFENAVDIYSRIYGPDHPNLASLLNNLAGLLRNQGKYQQAVELYHRSLAIRIKVLGPEHPIAAESLNNLAIVLSDMGELEEAEKMSMQCLSIAKAHYNTDHPEFVNYKGNYGIVLKAMGKNAEAKQCMEEALQLLRGKDFQSGHVWLVKFQSHLDELIGTHSA